MMKINDVRKWVDSKIEQYEEIRQTELDYSNKENIECDFNRCQTFFNRGQTFGKVIAFSLMKEFIGEK